MLTLVMDVALIILPILLAGLTFIILLRSFGNTWLAYPLDMGITYKGKQIFGKNKTLRGPLIMGFFTGFYGLMLSTAFGRLQVSTELFMKYALVGLAYSLGELPNSFIKRQLDIPPGGRSADQVKSIIIRLIDNFDSLFACGIAYLFLFNFSLFTISIAILMGGILHSYTDVLMVKLNLKKDS